MLLLKFKNQASKLEFPDKNLRHEQNRGTIESSENTSYARRKCKRTARR